LLPQTVDPAGGAALSVVQRVRPLRHLSLGFGQVLHAPPTRTLLLLVGEALARRRLDVVRQDRLRAWDSPAMAEACQL